MLRYCKSHCIVQEISIFIHAKRAFKKPYLVILYIFFFTNDSLPEPMENMLNGCVNVKKDFKYVFP